MIYRYFLNDVDNRKNNFNKIMTLCDLTRYELEKPYGRVPEKKHHQLQQLLCHNHSAHDEFIHHNIIGKSINTSYQLFPEFTGFIINQENLSQALTSLLENIIIIGNCDTYKAMANDEEFKIVYQASGPESLQKVNAIGNILLLSELIHFYSPNTKIKVNMMAPSLNNKNIFDEFFNYKCLLNQNENSITINKKELVHRHHSHNKFLSILQQHQVTKIKNNIQDSATFSSLIADLLFNIIYSQKISEQAEVLMIMCDVLKISRWTLNRRLKKEGTNFKTLFGTIKINVATKLLKETNLSIQEVSDWLAFSSHSAFTRFFRTQMKLSPTEYRMIKNG